MSLPESLSLLLNTPHTPTGSGNHNSPYKSNQATAKHHQVYHGQRPAPLRGEHNASSIVEPTLPSFAGPGFEPWAGGWGDIFAPRVPKVGRTEHGKWIGVFL